MRNLTDEMLTAMGEKGCLIGLNYCASFLDTNPDRSQVRSRITDMARHARYIMDKKKEGVPERVVEKIFYGNAVRFFSENL